jgi:hypothetical protein
MTRLWQWLGRHESLMDWMAAWFGGSAFTAFQLHNPGAQGWIYLILAGACFIAGVTAHCIEERPA